VKKISVIDHAITARGRGIDRFESPVNTAKEH